MKKLAMILAAATFALSAPLLALAAMDHGGMDMGMDHSGHSAGVAHEEVVDGVKASFKYSGPQFEDNGLR